MQFVTGAMQSFAPEEHRPYRMKFSQHVNFAILRFAYFATPWVFE